MRTPDKDIHSEVEKWITPKYFDEEFESVLKEFHSWSNMWRYLIERFPIKIDGEIPKMTRDGLFEDDVPACFTGDYIAVEKTILRAHIIDAIARSYKRDAHQYGGDVEDYIRWEKNLMPEIRTVMAHEFTHLLSEHMKQRKKRLETNQIDVFPAYVAAEEIEANRGYGVAPTSAMYATAITEEEFPETKGVVKLWDMYLILREKFKDELNEAFDEAMEELDQENEQSDDSSGNGSTESSGGNTDKDETEDADEKDGRKQQLKEAFKQAMRERKADEKFSPGIDILDELGVDDEQARQMFQNGAEVVERDCSVQLGGTAGAVNGEHISGNVEVPEYSPVEKLQYIYDKRQQKEIAKALAKMRNIIKGESVKTKSKTYSRPPRRSYSGSLMRKGVKRDKQKAPSILLALDSSGSMESTRVTSVATTVNNIVKTLGRNISNCYICLHTHEIEMCEKLRNWEKVVKMYSPHGGNDFHKVYQKAIDLGVDVVLNVGDGLDYITERGKKNEFSKTLEWFDVIVSSINGYSENYWGGVLVDEGKGIIRKTLPLVPETEFQKLSPEREAELRQQIQQGH